MTMEELKVWLAEEDRKLLAEMLRAKLKQLYARKNQPDPQLSLTMETYRKTRVN